MSLNSYEFVFVFLPATLVIFWAFASFARRDSTICCLLLASIIFYAHSGLMSIAAIAPTIVFDYAVALLLIRLPPARELLKRTLLFIAICINVLLLGYFKYKNF